MAHHPGDLILRSLTLFSFWLNVLALFRTNSLYPLRFICGTSICIRGLCALYCQIFPVDCCSADTHWFEILWWGCWGFKCSGMRPDGKASHYRRLESSAHLILSVKPVFCLWFIEHLSNVCSTVVGQTCVQIPSLRPVFVVFCSRF